MLNYDPLSLLARLLTLLIAFPIHEFAHAKTADAFGDTTPRMNGRVTLNPLAHLDIFGALIFMATGFGWAKPVPVNPFALGKRSSAAYMLVALAGPLSNFLMAILVAIPVRVIMGTAFMQTSAGGFISQILYQVILYNLILAFFNLIPLAPLDGDKIADFFFPPSWARVMDRIRPYGPIVLMLLMFAAPMVGINIIGALLYPPIMKMLGLLVG